MACVSGTQQCVVAFYGAEKARVRRRRVCATLVPRARITPSAPGALRGASAPVSPLPFSGKGNSNSQGARPVHLIITTMKWFRTSRLSIENYLSIEWCAENLARAPRGANAPVDPLPLPLSPSHAPSPFSLSLSLLTLPLTRFLSLSPPHSSPSPSPSPRPEGGGSGAGRGAGGGGGGG